MLSIREQKVMQILYKESLDKSAILISPVDLSRMLGQENFSISQVEKLIADLNTDGYFDLVYSDRRGETVYCISLTSKGKGFLRDKKLLKRNLIYRLVISVSFAILSFIIGLILKRLF